MRLNLKWPTKARLGVRWMAILALLAAMVLPATQVTLAVHDLEVVELDGNIADDPAVDGTDWAALFNASGVRTGTPLPAGTTELAHFFNKDFSTLASGRLAPDTSYFQPSSKDHQTINPAGGSDVWGCTTANVADKDDIINGYAVLADAPDTDATNGAINRIAYVGMERFDNSGNAFFGVWLFQSTVGCTPTGKFTGTKTVGDVFAIIDFEGGGTNPANTHITAYKWVGSGGDVPGVPQFDLLSAGAGCALAGTGDDLCAVVNTTTLTPPWPFSGKGGANVLPNQFVEAGFNLSDLFGASAGGLPCFSTILIETRSSSSIDATLKDYLSGSFQSCRPTMATQASTNGTVQPGLTEVTDTATITVTGGSNPPDPTSPPNVFFFLCGPTASATDCTTGGTAVGNAPLVGGASTTDGTATAVSPAVNTSAAPLDPGFYCFRAEWAGNATYPGAISHTNDDTECFQVVSPTAITTRQFVFPQDKATITAVAGNLAGNVVFSLYDTLANCQANGTTGRLFTSGNIAISGPSPQSATTNNTTARVSTDTTVYWNVVYTPTNTQTGSSSTCVESTAVNFEGDNLGISIP